VYDSVFTCDMQVKKHFETECATSPCAKDQVRMRLGTGMYLVAQALIMMGTLWALYTSLQLSYPAMFPTGAAAALSFTTFKSLKPWNLQQSKQKTCECKCCENFGGYEKGLARVCKLLSGELGELSEEDEESSSGDDSDSGSGDSDGGQRCRTSRHYSAVLSTPRHDSSLLSSTRH
jgi:hypothetical protein